MSGTKDNEVTLIKKYTNRRLYNTATSIYITLSDLCEMVKCGEDFKVVDSKTGEDLTRQTLTQIIFEQESKGYNLLPTSFLKQIIKYYDDSMNTVVPKYLETTMEYFSHNRENIENIMKGSFNNPFNDVQNNFKGFGIDFYEKMAQQNLDIFNNAMGMMSPFTNEKKDNKDENK